MSRSNKNNRKKIRLSDNGTNEQPLRCSSSSGSSNYSDDMDVIRNAVLESLMKNAASGAATTPTAPSQTGPFIKSSHHLSSPSSSSYDQQEPRHRRQRRDGKSDDESRHHKSFSAATQTPTTTTTTTTTAAQTPTTTTVDSSRPNRKLDTRPVARASATTTIEELALATDAQTDPNDDQIRTDVKIVRIKTLDSEESKLLLIVDVLDRNPFRVEVDSRTETEAKKPRDQETSPKCIKVDIEALKRGECPKEIRNLCTKVRSRRIYKLPDELMRKFDQKGLRVFEWHSFNRPDEVIKLLLEEGSGAGPATSPPAASTVTAAAAADILRKRMIIGFRRRSPTKTTAEASAATTIDEPASKIRRTNAPSEPELATSGIRKSGLVADQRNRNRILQRLLKEYTMSGGGAGNATTTWDTTSPTKMNRLVRSQLDLRSKQANERANMTRRKETDVQTSTTMALAPKSSEARWKSTTSKLAGEIAPVEFNTSTLKRDSNLKAAKILLNDDNDASVANNTDVTAIDGSNSDALDNSNNDDNDSKAKKKNRCALCRKKVGLTGFECRCGGLYCGIHRYSDKHNCTFDYRQLGAQEIRRNNPVVIGEKIQKI